MGSREIYASHDTFYTIKSIKEDMKSQLILLKASFIGGKEKKKNHLQWLGEKVSLRG